MKVFCKVEITAQQGNIINEQSAQSFLIWGLFVLEIFRSPSSYSIPLIQQLALFFVFCFFLTCTVIALLRPCSWCSQNVA